VLSKKRSIEQMDELLGEGKLKIRLYKVIVKYKGKGSEFILNEILKILGEKRE